MVELVSFHSIQFGTKFIVNKFVSFIPITMIENYRMPEMHGMG